MHFNLVLVCFEKLVYNTQLVKVLFRYPLVFITRYCFKKQHQLKSKEKKPCKKCAIITIANMQHSRSVRQFNSFVMEVSVIQRRAYQFAVGTNGLVSIYIQRFRTLPSFYDEVFFCKYSYCISCISYRNQSFFSCAKQTTCFYMKCNNYIYKNTASWMFDMVLNTPLYPTKVS